MDRMILLGVAFGSAISSSALAGGLPARVGACTETTIKEITTRLCADEDGVCKPEPGSGSAVSFENGGYQVSYDTEPAIEKSVVGDPVRMCLVNIPTGCPKGDDRGYTYRTTNLRTHQSWELANSEHLCGGA